MMSLTPRRCVFWALLALAGAAALVLDVPALQFVTIRGKSFGGNAYPYATLACAFAGLLLWSALYVRVEPLLVSVFNVSKPRLPETTDTGLSECTKALDHDCSFGVAVLRQKKTPPVVYSW
jgi:hypothetical protein